MGKKLRQQKKGKASPSYINKSKRFRIDLRYRTYDDEEKTGVLRGQIIAFKDDPARDAILMQVLYDNNETVYLPAPEGAVLNDYIESGAQSKLSLGGVLPLYRIPDGMYVYNLEKNPGDGGKMIRTPGSYAIIVSREKDKVYIKLPSKKIITLSINCRAQIGIVSGGGRKESPLLKAGTAYYKHHAKNKYWPHHRGVKLNAYNHPHGGKQHHTGKSTTVGKGTPPGRKVGHIAARVTGRKKNIKNIKRGID